MSDSFTFINKKQPFVQKAVFSTFFIGALVRKLFFNDFFENQTLFCDENAMHKTVIEFL